MLETSAANEEASHLTPCHCFSVNKDEVLDNELEKSAEKELLEREDAEMVGFAAFLPRF